MLKMQDDPDELLKTKGKRKRKTIDPDDCMKTKGLPDNRGEARMLLKRKALIALFAGKFHRSMRLPHRGRHQHPRPCSPPGLALA
jgi:hypothetical protein